MEAAFHDDDLGLRYGIRARSRWYEGAQCRSRDARELSVDGRPRRGRRPASGGDALVSAAFDGGEDAGRRGRRRRAAGRP
eukprot:9497710-Pyramimonas_sp.AAC.1